MDHELDEMVLLRNAWRIAKLDRDKYELQNAELLGRLNKLTRQLDQARSIATLLEGECSACWGPIHKDALEQVQALTRIEEATDVRDDYIEVSERIRMFKDAYPEGSLQSDWGFTERDGEQWLTVRAYAYRTADDARPGIGHAWEPIPGRTPYTKGSELMVGETSAWGRALAALGIAVHKGIASAQEIRSAQARTPDLAQQRADAMPAYKTPSGATKQEGHQLATAKQIGLLKGTMSKQHINEALLADFCTDTLGFELPVTGLDRLTKAQASVIIDALLKSDQPMTVTRTRAKDPDDPWADVPLPPEPTR
jgi:hypothetical protein